MTPLSLFPPSFEAVKNFVLAMIEGGIGLGRLFAEATIRFVESVLFGIA